MDKLLGQKMGCNLQIRFKPLLQFDLIKLKLQTAIICLILGFFLFGLEK